MNRKVRKTVSLTYTKGVEGNCIYLNGYRICGPKPWGGGTILAKWEVEIKDIKTALSQRVSEAADVANAKPTKPRSAPRRKKTA
jgi:hypothetical protein